MVWQTKPGSTDKVKSQNFVAVVPSAQHRLLSLLKNEGKKPKKSIWREAEVAIEENLETEPEPRIFRFVYSHPSGILPDGDFLDKLVQMSAHARILQQTFHLGTIYRQ